MKQLTKKQIKGIVNWLERWEMLKNSAVPLRFREEFRKKPRPINVFKTVQLSNGVMVEILTIDGYFMKRATLKSNGNSAVFPYCLMEDIMRIDGKPIGSKGVDELNVSDFNSLAEILTAQMTNVWKQ